MLPYVFLLGATLLGGWFLETRGSPRRNCLFLAVMGTACWLVASLRYQTGYDYRFYETIFQSVAETSLGNLWSIQHIEPGYLLLNKLVALFGGGYRAFLFVFHFLFCSLLFLWIGRHSKIPWLSVWLFLTLQYFALSMNLLRQSMAALIILLSYQSLLRRKALPFFGIVLLAACFHRTALIMLPFYFLLNWKVTKRHYGIAALAAVAAYFTMDPLLQLAVTIFPDYQQYLTSKYWQGNSFLYVLLPLACFLFTLLFSWGKIRPRPGAQPKEPVNRFLVNAMFYSFLLQLFITRHFVLERFSIYLAVFALAALPEAVLPDDGARRKRYVRTGLLLAGGLLYFIFAASGEFHDVYPYVGVWSRALTNG